MTQHNLPIAWPPVILCFLWTLAGLGVAHAHEFNQVAGKLIVLNSNGAWSWYMDERVIVDTAAGKILTSSVANANGTDGATRNGDIDVVSYDLASGQASRFVLHQRLQADDHK